MNPSTSRLLICQLWDSSLDCSRNNEIHSCTASVRMNWMGAMAELLLALWALSSEESEVTDAFCTEIYHLTRNKKYII